MTREEAKQHLIEIRDGLIEWAGLNNDGLETFGLAIAALEHPDPPRGRWKLIRYERRYRFYSCSICGTIHAMPTNYCPECGADMKGDVIL